MRILFIFTSLLVTTYKLGTGDLYYKDEYIYNGQTITQTRTTAAAGTGYKANNENSTYIHVVKYVLTPKK